MTAAFDRASKTGAEDEARWSSLVTPREAIWGAAEARLAGGGRGGLEDSSTDDRQGVRL